MVKQTSVALGVREMPIHFCCTLITLSLLNRSSLLPVHRFGSHCPKSHMTSGTAKLLGTGAPGRLLYCGRPPPLFGILFSKHKKVF